MIATVSAVQPPARAGRLATPGLMHELDVVRVTALKGSAVDHLSVSRAQRAPRIGDVGSIVQVVEIPGQPRYLVESVTGEGEMIWLAELSPDEVMLESTFETKGRG